MTAEPTPALVLVEQHGGVVLVTMNRPEKLNALNSAMVSQLEQAITQLDADPSVSAIVITGAGERAFSAGGDMNEQVAAMEQERATPRVNASLLLHEVKKPTIAAIRGYCFGGGALLAIHCDIRIGGHDARLKFHGASYGRAPGGAVLPRIVGEAKAKELLFTGDEVQAAEALRIGLLNQVVAPEAVLETAIGMAERIAANSPPAVTALKEIIERALPVDKALEHELEVNQGMGRTGQCRSISIRRRAHHRPAAELTMSMPRWLDWAVRGYLVFAAVQAFGIGLTGLFVPPEMQIPLRLTPLNYRFVAALYVSGGVGIVLALFAPRLIQRRLVTVAFGLATLLVLLLTIIHWPEFMGDDLPHRQLWMFVYVADPLLALILVPLARLWPPRPGGRHLLSALLWIDAAVFGALGLVLLLAPETAATYWPWVLPPLVGQLYACFILTFAVGAILAARETEPRVIRDYLIALLSLCVLVLLVSVLHLDRFKPGPITFAWFALFAIGAFGCVAGLTAALRQAGRIESVARA